jgi:hypothetical protein
MTMAQYRCRKPFLLTRKVDGRVVGPVLYEAGAVISYDGLPGGNLEPLDEEAKAKAVEAEAVFAAQRQEAAIKANESTRAAAAALSGVVAAAIAEALEGFKATAQRKAS